MKARYIISAAYILAFLIIVGFLQMSFLILLLAYLVISAAIFAIYYPNVLAVAGNYLFGIGKTEKGLEVLKKAMDKKTKSPMAYLNYAIHLIRNGDADKAMQYLDIAQSLDPKIITDKNIRLTRGSCYWVMGDLDRAIEELETLRERYTYVNVHVLTTLGFLYLAKGDIENALLFTEKAIEDTPSSGAAWDNMGQIHYRTGENAKAKEAFLQAVEYKKDLADSLYYLGLIAEEEGDNEAAQSYFRRASESNITALNTVTREQITSKLQVV